MRPAAAGPSEGRNPEIQGIQEVQRSFNGLQSTFWIFRMLKRVSLHGLDSISFEKICQMQNAVRLLIRRTLYSSELVFGVAAYSVFRHSS